MIADDSGVQSAADDSVASSARAADLGSDPARPIGTPWSLPRTLLFRWAVVYLAIYIFRFPFGEVPVLGGPVRWISDLD